MLFVSFLNYIKIEEYKMSSIAIDKLKNIKLDDLKKIKTLGAGAFGSVDLVQIHGDLEHSFALKKIPRAKIITSVDKRHLKSEMKILGKVSCDFIVKMYSNYQDRSYTYILMESCLGGDLWTLLRTKKRFDAAAVKFYTACVVEALDYLHSRNIVYRDLKPENLLLDNKGYVKLADFGMAKELRNGEKTKTFCGTSYYMAPEVIIGRGHDVRADCWSLGVLVFELLTGEPPFNAENRNERYKLILSGIRNVDIPEYISSNALDLIMQLCMGNPSKRLRISYIRRHIWYQGFSWEDLLTRRLQPPILPEVSSVTYTRNFKECSPESKKLGAPITMIMFMGAYIIIIIIIILFLDLVM